MTKFTNGVWDVNPDNPLEVRVGGRGKLICDATNISMSHPERLANARLLAAAPGLYDFIARISRIVIFEDMHEDLELILENANSIIKALDLEGENT